MTGTYSLEILSGSTNGLGVKVTGTTSGTSVLVHTAVAGVSDIDEVTLWAVNRDADGESRTVTIGWGGETDPDNVFKTPVPADAGIVPLTDRLPLRNALEITAWADEANDVVIYGVVYRVDKS